MNTHFYGASEFSAGTFFCKEGRKERRASMDNVIWPKLKWKEVSKAWLKWGTAGHNGSDATALHLSQLLLKLQFSCWWIHCLQEAKGVPAEVRTSLCKLCKPAPRCWERNWLGFGCFYKKQGSQLYISTGFMARIPERVSNINKLSLFPQQDVETLPLRSP